MTIVSLSTGNILATGVERVEDLKEYGIKEVKFGVKCATKLSDKMIIGVNREMVDSVRASLCVFKEKMSVERVSGTIKGLGK